MHPPPGISVKYCFSNLLTYPNLANNTGHPVGVEYRQFLILYAVFLCDLSDRIILCDNWYEYCYCTQCTPCQPVRKCTGIFYKCYRLNSYVSLTKQRIFSVDIPCCKATDVL